ncbi:unnamed protein product [Bursaphelenchus okinawaensis]|uniref:WD_REPEATS_REGION domain-containing protein n=1 Tax=Bursaphelenchus okinawaensis TaxID=465554 RepID=A0A811LFB2_9BILA|nr:unnamed protein product [Bursaphelenchus okinawaensis]CAG9121951.1 unnamed protein product [Bursaphelenchus okinawaensis]
MESKFQLSDVVGAVFQNGNLKFFDKNHLACPIGNRVKVMDLKNDASHILDCESNFNIVHMAFTKDASMVALINEIGIASLVSLTMNSVVYQRKVGKNVRCAAFSPNNKYLAFGMDGYIAIYAVDTQCISPEPLRLLSRRQFANMSSQTTFTHLEWSFDSKLLTVSSNSHIQRVYAPLKALPRFNLLSLSERSEVVGGWFRRDQTYDVLLVTKRGLLTEYDASLTPGEVSTPLDDDQTFKEGRMFYKFNEKAAIYDKFESQGRPNVVSAAFSKPNELLAIGFENSEIVIVKLSMGMHVTKHLNLNLNLRIEAIDLNDHLLAFGTGRGYNGALYVWDQRSEIFAVKQQSHTKTIRTAVYSPLGHVLATGGDDGLVKIWNSESAMCIVTLKGHSAPVTSLCFTENGNAILSASLDGQVIAHDMKKYRNFRTMVTPKETQLEHLCADKEGLNCIASSQNTFEIFVWAIETGNLLEILTGHTAPITALSLNGLKLASASMDKTVRIWDVTRMENEAIQFGKECVDVKYSPDGFYLAVLLFDSAVHVLSAETNAEIYIIDSKLDMDIGWQKGNLSKNSVEKNKSYNRIEFSPTSKLLLVGGQSNNFSLYDFVQHSLIRRFRLTANQSIDGTNPRFDPLSYHSQQIDASDDENEVEAISAPGEAKKDLSLRKFDRPSIELTEFAYNPTGRSFAAVSTEGVMVFSLDKRRRFRPMRLVEGATIEKAQELLDKREYHQALLMGLALDDKELVEKVLVQIPTDEIQTEVQRLEDQVAVELLRYLGANINKIAKVRIHHYLLICRHLVFQYAQTFKADNTLTDAITSLQFFVKSHKDLLQIIESNKGLIDFELTQRQFNELNREMREMKPAGA